ncbi:MAG: S-adenosylmethionine:tRNA ribosyltransferase-isomerase [Anaerolineae bacterium]|nr:MAG: S-adenosylmethionine:tRNA ribosyltransferase-isomerase [Anaerolineae bacterium]
MTVLARTAAERKARQTVVEPFLFTLPKELEATEPPEARGVRRDRAPLLVTHYETDRLAHHTFADLPNLLTPGDVLIINTSATVNAALPARGPDGKDYVVHLATRLPGGLWALEVRRKLDRGTEGFEGVMPGDRFELADGGSIEVSVPYRLPHLRIWLARLSLPVPWEPYLATHGRPIRYNYVPREWPLEAYQTAYASQPGSAEMPSAGRGFTRQLLTTLAAREIHIAPIVLHTGLSSPETHEGPYPEYFQVPQTTADLVNAARRRGQRVVAVGTTSVRATETMAGATGRVKAGEGYTDLVIDPDYSLRVVDGLLTGFHEPEATHLAMLEALAGRAHVRLAYEAALAGKYLWHEFGDFHLLLP